MAKITGIYEITLPNIPTSIAEIPTQRPIIINKDIEQIKIYPPGYNCEKVWKRIQGKHLRIEGRSSQTNIQNADSFSILIEKDSYASNKDEAEAEYKKLDAEIEYLAFKMMRLFRKHLPKTPIALPNQLQYKCLCKSDSESLKNILWSRPSRGNTVIYMSSQYYLDREKWSALRKAIRNHVDTEMWEDFIYDANAALESRDFTKAITYAAIACEVFIKEYTEKAAKEAGISKIFWKYLKSRQPRSVDYYDSILHLVKGHSLRAENRKIYELVDLLYKARNKVMHEGKRSFSEDEHSRLRKYIGAVEEAISWVLNPKSKE